VDRIWQAHWPPGVDEARIRLPDEPLPSLLKATAARVPRKAALVFYGREVSFAELDQASDRFAGWLRGRGVGPGDRVALYLENCPQFAVAHFGALKVGAITVALNPMHKAHELGHELEDSEARVIVAADAGRELVEHVRDRSALDTVVLTSYRDYLPDEPTLPLPPSLLEPAPRRAAGGETSGASSEAGARSGRSSRARVTTPR
jgi:acyl-CoA synthetase (AMP-forming)/AMP-acid ligase II